MLFSSSLLWSEIEFQAELDPARVARRRDPAEIAEGEARARLIVVHTIEQIEELRPELQLGRFSEEKIPGEREIERRKARPANAWQCARRIAVGERRRGRESECGSNRKPIWRI
jgi:hypothetical protein